MRTHAAIAQDGDSNSTEPKAENRERSAGEPRKRFIVDSRPLGLRHDLNFNKIEEVLDLIESPDRR